MKAWLFGSYARGEQTEDSDVDIAVIFDPDAHVSLLDHAGIMCDLEDITGKAVDVATYDTIYPRIKKEVDKDKILIYMRELIRDPHSLKHLPELFPQVEAYVKEFND